MKKVVLVDGTNLIFRAYYATAYTGNLMRNSKGLHTNGLFGFVNMINKIMREEKPDHILIAFDKGKTFRHEQYDDYKGGRSKVPEELIEQFPYTREICEGLGVKWLEVPGFEADDIIGTFSLISDKEGYKSVVISSDKDMLQLVSDHTTVKLISKGDFVLYDEKTLLEEKGVTPSQIRDMKGLEGDKSDNIPGVRGVGAKTALKLLTEYGSLEGIYENIEKIKGKLQEKLINDKENAFMSKDLATIREDIDLGIEVDETLYNGINREKLMSLYEELEFNNFLKNIAIKKEVVTNHEIKILDQVTDKTFKDGCAIVVELDKENYHQAQVLGLGVYDGTSQFFVPIEVLIKSNVDLSKVKNVKTFDYKQAFVAFKWMKKDFAQVDFDLLLAQYVLNPSVKSDLAFSALEYGVEIDFKEKVFGKGRSFKIPNITDLAKYVSEKARFIYEVEKDVTTKLKDNKQYELYHDLELPLSIVLGDMEHTGINIDSDFLSEMGKSLDTKLEDLTDIIYSEAGEKFNISSPKQLGVVLFDNLGIRYPSKVKAGKSYSTAADILDKVRDLHPIIPLVLEYRKLKKIKSTYIEGLLSSVYEDGKVHTIFQQAFTATGRLSSIEPNIQNIPVRTKIGREIRKAFKAKDGNIMLACDYSQIELRVLAHISKAENLIEAFNNDMDIHTKTAMDIFNVGVDEVTANMRRAAKAVNFGIVYGISSYGLSQNIDVSVEEAKAFIDAYNEKFPGIRVYMDDTVLFCKDHGFVETLMNRRRYIPEIDAKNFMQRSFAERMAMNTPIQGSAADIIKKAMVEVYNAINGKFKSKLIAQVHDELIIDCTPDEVDEITKIVVETMEQTVKLNVKLKVDYNTGKNWYEAK